MPRAAQLVGQVFERLTVRRREGSSKRGQALWCCECVCGGSVIVPTVDLRSGNTRSCGCMQAEARDQTTHGESRTRLYGIWIGIKRRCGNENDKLYPYYGGRGIEVAEEWSDYETFRDWSRAHGYESWREIDRKDNDGPYSPDNCHWVDRRTNVNNRGVSLWVEYDGQNMPLSEACERAGLKYKTVHMRIRRGWSVERALGKEAS